MEGTHDGMTKPLEDVAADGFGGGDRTQLIPGKVPVTSAPTTTGDVGSGSSVEDGSEVAPLQMEMDKAKKVCQADGLHVIIVSAIVFSIAVTVALIITIYFGPPQVPPRGAVASDSSQCSEVGVDILKKDGSAVDAAIATVLCLGVVHPHATGIGGGGVMLVRNNAEKTSHVIDFLPTAPGGASKGMFQDGKAMFASKGGLSVAVPSQLKGLRKAHHMFGKLSWKELVMPSVDIARNGFLVSQELADAVNDELNHDSAYTQLVSMFTQNGAPVRFNQTLKLPQLANTLEKVANDGVEAFYSGIVAQDMVDEVNNDNGILTKADLRDYEVNVEKPLETIFHNVTVQSTGPPTAGAMVVEALAILNNFPWTNSSANQFVSYQRLIEALKFAYAERGVIGDPVYSPDVLDITKHMLNTSSAAYLAGKVDDNRTHDVSYYGHLVGMDSQLGTSQVSVFGTKEDMVSLTTNSTNRKIASHVSVIGPSEGLVTVTTSLNEKFGSHVMTSHGVLLNSFMDYFAEPDQNADRLHPNPNNYIEPGKRPSVPMAPTVTFNAAKPCNRRIAIGGEGGTSIVSGVVSVILRLVGFREHLQTAIEAPRFHDQLVPEGLQYERAIDKALIQFMKDRNHKTSEWDRTNIINAVAKINETIEGWADTRGGGKAAIFGENKAVQ